MKVEEAGEAAVVVRLHEKAPARCWNTGRVKTHREDTSMSTESIPDGKTPATSDDLRWWLDIAPTLKWTWAKTYADFAPHWTWSTAGRPA